MPTNLELAADNARLRKHLSTVLGILPQDFRGSMFWEEDDGYFEEHQWHKEAREALATPPAEAVAAIEGVVDSLESKVCDLCGNRIGWTGEHGPEQRRHGRTDWRDCGLCRRARAALAAYRAAIGEASNG